MFRKGLVLVMLGAMGGLLLGCAGGKVKGPTDEELVTRAVTDWKAAWEQKDVEGITAGLSPGFMTADGGMPEDVREYAQRLFAREGNRLEFLLEEMEVSVEGEIATVDGVRGRFTGRDSEGRLSEGLIGFSLRLRKEQDEWLITWLDRWSL
jgi:ketosteroid isomerase-like protein